MNCCKDNWQEQVEKEINGLEIYDLLDYGVQQAINSVKYMNREFTEYCKFASEYSIQAVKNQIAILEEQTEDLRDAKNEQERKEANQGC